MSESPTSRGTTSTSSPGWSSCSQNSDARRTDQREAIAAALKALAKAGRLRTPPGLFATLGYASDRRIPIATAKQFREQLDPGENSPIANAKRWISSTRCISCFNSPMPNSTRIAICSTIPRPSKPPRSSPIFFFAADLPPGQYTRTALSTLVRAINKPLPMPALVLFRHGDLAFPRHHPSPPPQARSEPRTSSKRSPSSRTSLCRSDPRPPRNPQRLRRRQSRRRLWCLEFRPPARSMAEAPRLLRTLQRLLPRDRRLVFLGASPSGRWHHPPSATLRHRAGKIPFPHPPAHPRHLLLVPRRETPNSHRPVPRTPAQEHS